MAGEPVTETTMMLYMGIIEQRTNEILQMWCLNNHKTKADMSEPLPTSPTVAPSTQQAMVNILGQGKVLVFPHYVLVCELYDPAIFFQ